MCVALHHRQVVEEFLAAHIVVVQDILQGPVDKCERGADFVCYVCEEINLGVIYFFLFFGFEQFELALLFSLQIPAETVVETDSRPGREEEIEYIGPCCEP